MYYKDDFTLIDSPAKVEVIITVPGSPSKSFGVFHEQ